MVFWSKHLRLYPVKAIDAEYHSFITKDHSCVLHIKKDTKEQFLISEEECNLRGLPLGERVKARRTQLGLSQNDVANASGLTQAMVAILEAGKAYPKLDSVMRLKRALNVDIGFFDE